MKSKYFKIHELVPKEMYKDKGEGAWRYVPKSHIKVLDKLKEHFNLGTMTVNNYYWGGDREWSAGRYEESEWYSFTSMHGVFCAYDIVFSHYSAEEVRNYIIDNHHEFRDIGGIELGVSWVHIDFRNTDHLVLFGA